MSLIYSDDESSVLEVIRAVKRGQGRQPDTITEFTRAATELCNHGADVLVLACTELSVIADALDNTPIPVFDTLQVLAEEVVAVAGER